MIRLGLADDAKQDVVRRYCAERSIRRVFALSPDRFMVTFAPGPPVDHIEYSDTIEYRVFYRLLQEIDADTLVVINECLRTQNRYDLTYNCIRNFLNQTSHQIVFQYLPLIDRFDDFMVLFDWETRSRWKREKWNERFKTEMDFAAEPVALEFHEAHVPVDSKTRVAYARKKRELIDGIGLKDPHTIPRNLYLMSGKAKLGAVSPTEHYIGRNNRFKIPTLHTYREDSYPERYTVFEFCHNFIDFSDFLALSRQTSVDILTSDLKVDGWYLQRYRDWATRIADAYAALQ